MEIKLHGRLVTCTPEEYKRLIDLNLIEVPAYQTSNTDTLGICDHWVEDNLSCQLIIAHHFQKLILKPSN